MWLNEKYCTSKFTQKTGSTSFDILFKKFYNGRNRGDFIGMSTGSALAALTGSLICQATLTTIGVLVPSRKTNELRLEIPCLSAEMRYVPSVGEIIFSSTSKEVGFCSLGLALCWRRMKWSGHPGADPMQKFFCKSSGFPCYYFGMPI